MLKIQYEEESYKHTDKDNSMRTFGTTQELCNKFANLITEDFEGKAKVLEVLNKQNAIIEELKQEIKLLKEKESNTKSNELMLKKSTLSAKMPEMTNMNSQQSCFSGKENEDIDNWLFNINLNLAASFTPEKLKLLRAAGYLRENALQIFRQIINEKPNITWDECQTELSNSFEVNQDFILREMGELKQTGTITEYVRKFKFLAYQVYKESETIKIIQFERNLDEELCKEIRFQHPKTLEQAMQIAIDYERSGKGSPVSTIRNINRAGRIDNRICFYCNKKGHIQNNCFKRLRTEEFRR